MKDKQLLELVKKASKGSKDAFAQLCNLKAREVIYLCVRELQNQQDGEDAAQEVFIRMQRSLPGLKAPEAFNVWLNRLIHTTCSNLRRDSMKHKNAIPIDAFDDSFWQDDSAFALPQEMIEDADKRKMVAGMIEDLPDKYRNCVLLHYYQNLSYAEIADVLDISTDAVNNNIRMARRHLKVELEEQMGKPSSAWALAPLAAVGPALAACIQESAAASVSPAMVSGCLAAAGVPAGFGGGGASHAARSSFAAKMAFSVAATAVLAGTCIGVVLHNLPQRMAAPSPASSISQVASATEDVPAGQAQAGAVTVLAPVAGHIYISAGGQTGGLQGASVALIGADGQAAQTAQTGADGAYSFEGVPLGNYVLRLTVPTTGTGKVVDVSVGEGNILSINEGNFDSFTGLDVTLDMPTRLRGHLALYLGGEPLQYEDQYLPGVRVVLFGPDGEQVADAPVNGDGTYVFEDLLVTKKGTYTKKVEVDAAALGEELEVQDTEVELYPGYWG